MKENVEAKEVALIRDNAQIAREIMSHWKPSGEVTNVNALCAEALRFETLWSHGIAVYNQQTGEVAYSSPRLANILGWSPAEHRREGMAYLFRVTTPESVNHLLQDIVPELVDMTENQLRQHYASHGNSVFYDIDSIHQGTGTVVRAGMRVMVPAMERYRHPDWLVAVVADHSAFRSGNRYLLHKTCPGFQETVIWEETGLVARKENLFTKHEKDIIAHLRALPMAETAELMNISLNTLKTHIKKMCRRTDTRGVTGLLALSEMVGWV